MSEAPVERLSPKIKRGSLGQRAVMEPTRLGSFVSHYDYDRLQRENAELRKRIARYENWQPMSITPASRHCRSNELLHFYTPCEGDEGDTWWSGTWSERPDNATAWCSIVTPLGPHADFLDAALRRPA